MPHQAFCHCSSCQGKKFYGGFRKDFDRAANNFRQKDQKEKMEKFRKEEEKKKILEKEERRRQREAMASEVSRLRVEEWFGRLSADSAPKKSSGWGKSGWGNSSDSAWGDSGTNSGWGNSGRNGWGRSGWGNDGPV